MLCFITLPRLIIYNITFYFSWLYFQMFSVIKYKNSVEHGARHLFQEIKLVRDHCTADEQKVAFHSIQNNAWPANPESIALALCSKFLQ